MSEFLFQLVAYFALGAGCAGMWYGRRCIEKAGRTLDQARLEYDRAIDARREARDIMQSLIDGLPLQAPGVSGNGPKEK